MPTTMLTVMPDAGPHILVREKRQMGVRTTMLIVMPISTVPVCLLPVRYRCRACQAAMRGGVKIILRQGTATTISLGPFVDESDGVTAEQG